jgi:hypothetical protein
VIGVFFLLPHKLPSYRTNTSRIPIYIVSTKIFTLFGEKCFFFGERPPLLNIIFVDSQSEKSLINLFFKAAAVTPPKNPKFWEKFSLENAAAERRKKFGWRVQGSNLSFYLTDMPT